MAITVLERGVQPLVVPRGAVSKHSGGDFLGGVYPPVGYSEVVGLEAQPPPAVWPLDGNYSRRGRHWHYNLPNN